MTSSINLLHPNSLVEDYAESCGRNILVDIDELVEETTTMC